MPFLGLSGGFAEWKKGMHFGAQVWISMPFLGLSGGFAARKKGMHFGARVWISMPVLGFLGEAAAWKKGITPQILTPQILTPQIVVSYPISSHLRHICASSYLRSLSPIFTSSLSSSGLHILKLHFVFTPPDLHHVVTLSYLIIFNIYLENIIATLQLDIFTSSKLHLPALGPTVV